MKLLHKILLSFIGCYLIGILVMNFTLFATMRSDIPPVLSRFWWIYFLLAFAGVGVIYWLSIPLVKFMDDFEHNRDITNQQAFLVQKKASYLPYLAGLVTGFLFLVGSTADAFYLYRVFHLPLWKIITFPVAGVIAALLSFLVISSIIERIMYEVRELADQKNTLPSLKHPGPALFLKLFLGFAALESSLILFVGLFIHNAFKYEYLYMKADPQVFGIVRIGMIFILVVGILIVYLYSASFARISLLPLRKLGNYLKAISLGDLTHRLLSGASDELFSISRSASYMVNSLKLMVLRARDMGADITSAAENIRNSEEQQAHGAIETAQTMATTISTLHNLANSASQVRHSAERVADAAQATLSASEFSQRAIEVITTEMGSIKAKVGEVMHRITALEDRSQQINTIATVIDEITEQTNLLAINASIEASRAEGGGRGFSEVATQIRKLAERAANSTKEIESLITEIQSDTHSAADVTRESTASVEKSVESIKDTAKAIEEINKMIAQTTSAAQEILHATTEQKMSTDQIVSRIQDWSEVSRQFEISTRSLVDSTQQLNQLANDLKAAISGFKVE